MKMRLNMLDRAIGLFAPQRAVRRGMARALIDAQRGYDGAKASRHTDGWATRPTSADTEILGALPKLRDRIRDLERNSPHARKAHSVWRNNLIGTGIRPRSSNARAIELWEKWSKKAGADGQLDIYGLMDLAAGTMISGGDALIRRRHRRKSDGLTVPLQLQVMEGDLLDHTKNGTDAGRPVIQGIEFDGIGQRSAYWMFPQHPGNAWAYSRSNLSSRPVPASEIIHLYRKERTQVRGVPWGSAVINELRSFDDYEAAELIRKKTEACVVAIVLGAGEGQEGIAPSVVDANGVPVESFEPGLIAYAHGGKDIKFNDPKASGGFRDYKNASMHTVSAGYLVPYELLTGDLSLVNFSSARVGLVEFRRLVETIQWLCIIPMMLNRIWEWFCEAAWYTGLLDTPDVPVEWQPPEFQSVNPIDDVMADILAVRAGFKTLAEVIAKRGYDPVEVLREHAEFAKLLDELGLVFDSDPRKVTRVGNEQPSISRQSEEARSFPPLRAVT